MYEVGPSGEVRHDGPATHSIRELAAPEASAVRSLDRTWIYNYGIQPIGRCPEDHLLRSSLRNVVAERASFEIENEGLVGGLTPVLRDPDRRDAADMDEPVDP